MILHLWEVDSSAAFLWFFACDQKRLDTHFENVACSTALLLSRINFSWKNHLTRPLEFTLLCCKYNTRSCTHRYKARTTEYIVGWKLFCSYYLPRHEVGMAGNILIAGMVHGICTVSFRCPVYVCLQILNSFDISIHCKNLASGLTASPTAGVKNFH